MDTQQSCRHVCDCKMSKESGKSRSRVWKKAMWFTRKNKNTKLGGSCHCELDINLGQEIHNSNSWSFTRTASRKFRISSRRRRCKSENVKRSSHSSEKTKRTTETRPDTININGIGGRQSTCPTTATGNFCDFGTNSHISTKTSGKSSSNASLLTGIARELNPPAKPPLENVNYHVANQLSKSHSSSSFSSAANTVGKQHSFSGKGVRRCKSFPCTLSNTSLCTKQRKTERKDKALPPFNDKRYGLRRVATFSGKLNAELITSQMRKSMSANTGCFMKKGSASMGEIQDQDGSIIGIVHFYKSPNNNCVQQMNNLNHGFGTLEASKTRDICNFCEVQEAGHESGESNFPFSRHFCSSSSSDISTNKELPINLNTDRSDESNCLDGCHDCFPPSPYNSHNLTNEDSKLSSKVALENKDVINSELYYSYRASDTYHPTEPPSLQSSGKTYCDESDCLESCSGTSFVSLVPRTCVSLSEMKEGVQDELLKVERLLEQKAKNVIEIRNKVEPLRSPSGPEQQCTAHVIQSDTLQDDFEFIDNNCCHVAQNKSKLGTSIDYKAKQLTQSQCVESQRSTRAPEYECIAEITQPDTSQEDSRPLNDHLQDFDVDNSTLNQSSGPPAQDKDDIIDYGSCTNDTISLEIDSELGYASLGQHDTVNEYCRSDNLTETIRQNCGHSNEVSSSVLDLDENINSLWLSKEDDVNNIVNDDQAAFSLVNKSTVFLISEGTSDSRGSLTRVQEFVDENRLPDLNSCLDTELQSEPSEMRIYQNTRLLNLVDETTHFCRNQGKQIACTQVKDNLFDDVITAEKILENVEYCLEYAVELNYIWDKVSLKKEAMAESLQSVHYNIESVDVACIRNTVLKSSSSTSDYASCSDEDMSNQNDISINTWKTLMQSGLKGDDGLRPPVPGNVFKMRTELLLSWFEEFNDEQKNIVIKKLLDNCELPQMHLLSVAMEPNLHKSCPPNCQDMLVWLPFPVTLNILLYLDTVSLCQCNQVNKAWNELTNNQLLWQNLTRNPDYQMSEASSTKQFKRYTHPNGAIHWKKVLAERFLLHKNWLNGKYSLKTFNGHNQGIACVQFDDTRIVSGSSDKTIKLWDISNATSELMLTLAGHSGTVRCLDLNGNRLVSGSTDRTIKVWDLSFASYWAGASCKVTMVGHLHTVRCLQADEKKLVSGSYDKTVKVWDLKTGQCQLTLRGHTAAVLCVQFDDQKIVSGSYDKKIKVWDLSEGTCLMTLDGHHDAVTCLNLTHDGMKIITGSLDYSLKFWDLYTGKCYGTLDWITSEGHTAVVRCLQVDSWRIISGGDDKTLKVWELATGQRLLTLRYHSDGVTCMQFNDFAIVSGSYDRTVKLWDFTPKHPYLESVT